MKLLELNLKKGTFAATYLDFIPYSKPRGSSIGTWYGPYSAYVRGSQSTRVGDKYDVRREIDHGQVAGRCKDIDDKPRLP